MREKMQKDICRICLTGDEQKLVDLFCIDLQKNYASKVIFSCGVEIYENDQFPKKICTNCLDSVLLACSVKEKCIETDRMLRQQLKPEPNFYRDDEENLEENDGSNIPQNRKYKELSDDNERRKSKIQDYRCFFCDRLFSKINDKKNHIKNDHATELTCKVCSTKKPTSIATEKCLKDHKYGFDYLCQICAKPFRHKCYLVKHQATCHNEASNSDIFTCDQCGLHTKYKMNLYRHIKSVHLQKTRKFACPYSDTCFEMVYTTKEALNIHLYRMHDVPAPVNCGSCQLGFSYNSELKIHRKVCGGAERIPRRSTKNQNFRRFCEVVHKGFRCKVCGKFFAEKQNWSYHYSAYHRDNRTCDICNKEFTCYTNYRRHVNVHHKKIRNFHCDYPGCEKSFGQKGALINHKNTHTGEKPFSCNFCSFKSGDTTTITKHKKKMHSKKHDPF